MILFDQFKVPTINFGKCFAEFMTPIALLKSLAVKNLLRLLKSLTFEDAYRRKTCSPWTLSDYARTTCVTSLLP